MANIPNLPVTHMIHNANHTRFSRKAVVSHPSYLIKHPGSIRLPKKFRNLKAGIHQVHFEKYPDKTFVFNLYCDMGATELITIDNPNYANLVTGIGVYPILLYEREYPKDAKIVNNTINEYFNVLAISGRTIIDYTGPVNIYSPCKLTPITALHVETKNEDESDHQIRTFNLHHELRSLPNITRDLFVIDAENERAYILYKVGHTNITGLEEITRVETFCNPKYSVYFIKDERVVKTDDPKALACTHFESIKYDKFRQLEFNQNAICISYDDWRGNGFYIKISNDIAPTTEKFIKFINDDLFKENKLEVMYPLLNPYQANVLLDDYHVKTFFNKTKILVNEIEGPLTYFYKSALEQT